VPISPGEIRNLKHQAKLIDQYRQPRPGQHRPKPGALNLQGLGLTAGRCVTTWLVRIMTTRPVIRAVGQQGILARWGQPSAKTTAVRRWALAHRQDNLRFSTFHQKSPARVLVDVGRSIGLAVACFPLSLRMPSISSDQAAFPSLAVCVALKQLATTTGSTRVQIAAAWCSAIWRLWPTTVRVCVVDHDSGDTSPCDRADQLAVMHGREHLRRTSIRWQPWDGAPGWRVSPGERFSHCQHVTEICTWDNFSVSARFRNWRRWCSRDHWSQAVESRDSVGTSYLQPQPEFVLREGTKMESERRWREGKALERARRPRSAHQLAGPVGSEVVKKTSPDHRG